MKISRFAILFLVAFSAMVYTTWDEMTFVFSCAIQKESAYLNADIVDLIDNELKPGASLAAVQSLFEQEIPQGKFSEKPCSNSDVDDIQCGPGFYKARYPFGIHDCICGRPNRIFTLEFDQLSKLKSLNFIERKICA